MSNYQIDNYEYRSLYSIYPDTQEELVSYLENTLKLDPKKVLEEEERINNIEWEYKEYTFFLIPKGSPRPRTGGNHFYVKGAKELKRFFESCLENDDLLYHRCEFQIDVYLPTPIHSMSKIEILLAEKGLILPIVTPDFDNLAKTYTDPLQQVIILNDNIINPGCVKKYYSIKPRVNIKIRYQKEFDCKYNERKTIQSVVYKKMKEKGEID